VNLRIPLFFHRKGGSGSGVTIFLQYMVATCCAASYDKTTVYDEGKRVTGGCFCRD
jgi:hypothetical protein